MISKFLDPKNDIAFKKIFGTEKNKDILIHFLNDMLTFREKSPIQDVTFLKTNQDPEIAARKTSIVDILCRDEKGNQYIVEMQVAKVSGFEKRALYYASKAYTSQMVEGGTYEDLKEVIFLAITDFIMFPNRKAYKSEHVILDKETYEHHLKDFSFTFFELPKFHKDINDLKNVEEKWMYFFKHADETAEKDLNKIIGQDEIIERAYEELNRFSWDEVELRTYEQEVKRERDNIAAMNYALGQKYDEGLAAGMEKGKEEGKEEGRLEKIGIVKALHAQGISLAVISTATSLSEEEIKKLLS